MNLAATAAQCGRVWRKWDPRFAQRCLIAAEKAWVAAVANPSIYTFTPQSGGGDYADDTLSDEFYWAAAELLVSNAERLIALMRTQGYPNPYLPEDLQYWWGSNVQVLDQIVLIAAAYDVTRDRKYRDAAFEAMDYILGHNGLNQSYVTGYGSRYSQNQHHRFWSNQADPSLPHPPQGSLAGGPNSALQDPIASSELAGCAPHKCYIDDIDSYSTNEVAIHWNAALVWVSTWLAEQG